MIITLYNSLPNLLIIQLGNIILVIGYSFPYSDALWV